MATRDADVESRLTREDLHTIERTYRIPAHIKLSLPTSDERINHVEPRRLAVHEEPLRIGIRFPFEGLVADFLRVFDIAPGQMTPNSWRVVRQLDLWAREARVNLSGRCLLHLLTIKWSGEFLAVQGIANTKIVSGMPSSNKNWKPRFFFARRTNEAGEVIDWDVPVDWRRNVALPNAPTLSTEEKYALEAFREGTKEKTLAYTQHGTAREEQEAGRKRAREVMEVMEETPLAAIPSRRALREPRIERSQGIQIGGQRKVRFVNNAGKGGPSEQQQLKAAEDASAPAYEAEKAARREKAKELRRKQEVALQLAVQASAVETGSFVDNQVAGSGAEAEVLDAEATVVEVVDSEAVVLPEEAEAVESEVVEPALVLPEEPNPQTEEVSVTVGEEQTAPAAGTIMVEVEDARVPAAEGEAAEGGPTEATLSEAAAPPAGPLSESDAELVDKDRPMAALDLPEERTPPTEEVTVPVGEEHRSPPRPSSEAPSTAVGVQGSPLAERLSLVGLKPSTLPPFPEPKRTPFKRQALEARAKALMEDSATSGRATAQSAIELHSVGSDRGQPKTRRMELMEKIKRVHKVGATDGQDHSAVPEDASQEACQQLYRMDKEPQLPMNSEAVRRIRSPKEAEARPRDVAYDLYAGSSVHQLSERLAHSALQQARAAVQERVDALEHRLREAEESACRAESDREEVAKDMSLVAERLASAEVSASEGWRLLEEQQARADALERESSAYKARAEALEAESRGHEAKALVFEQENSRLSIKQVQLTEKIASLSAKLAEAEADAQATKAHLQQEQARATAAEGLSAESLQRAKDAEDALAKVRWATGTPPTGAIADEATVGPMQRVEELLRAMEEQRLAFEARATEADEAKAALSSQVKGLQHELDELKASSAAEARSAAIREVQENVEYYNSAVVDIEAAFPHLDLSRFLLHMDLHSSRTPPPSPHATGP